MQFVKTLLSAFHLTAANEGAVKCAVEGAREPEQILIDDHHNIIPMDLIWEETERLLIDHDDIASLNCHGSQMCSMDGQMRDGQMRDGQMRDGQMRDGQMTDSKDCDVEMFNLFSLFTFSPSISPWSSMAISHYVDIAAIIDCGGQNKVVIVGMKRNRCDPAATQTKTGMKSKHIRYALSAAVQSKTGMKSKYNRYALSAAVRSKTGMKYNRYDQPATTVRSNPSKSIAPQISQTADIHFINECAELYDNDTPFPSIS